MHNKKSIFKELYIEPYKRQPVKLYNHAKGSKDLVQRLGLLKRLPVHDGCVNTLQWSSDGQHILSGSDDQHLIITNAFSYKVLEDYETSHRANIFSAKFLPHSNDRQIISCSGDGILLHTDLARPKQSLKNKFNCHDGTTYEVVTIPNDPNTFLSCGEDGTVRNFDLREKSKCIKKSCEDDVLIKVHGAVTAMALHPRSSPHLAIGCSDSTVRVYDQRYICYRSNTSRTPEICRFMGSDLENRPYRITSLSYSANGEDILVSYSCDHLYLFNLYKPEDKRLRKDSANESWLKQMRRSPPFTKQQRIVPPPVRRLRLRGDWSDTGPDARPEREASSNTSGISQARSQLQTSLMQRMTDVLSRMLNDPMTRAALSAGGEDSLDQENAAQHPENLTNEEASAAQAENVEAAATAAVAADSLPEENVANIQDAEVSEADVSGETVEEPSTNAVPVIVENINENVGESDTQFVAEENIASSNNTPASSCSDSNQSVSSNVNTSVVTRQLRNRLSILRSLRQGFIEQHGAEPSVSLRYSNQSTSNSTISLSTGGYMNEESAPTATTAAENAENAADRGGNEDDNDVQLDYDFYEDRASSEPALASSSACDADLNEFYVPSVKEKYVGHRNARTMIKEATFWGEDYVMSGSDCGHVFVWDRMTAELVMLLQADDHVVNCLQPHPTLPYLATSGIDHDIKLWAPILEESDFDEVQAHNLMRRNAIMLEETKDTITVPAAFMIRMLASLNQIRHGRRTRRDAESHLS